MVTDQAARRGGIDLTPLQVDVLIELGDVAALASFVDALTDSHQRRLALMTPAAETAQNQQVRKERRDRRNAQRLGLPTGTGDVAAPGNFAAIAVAAEVWTTLRHQVRRASKYFEQRRVCPLARLADPDEPTAQDLIRVLSRQVLAIDDTEVLTELLTDLAFLEESTQGFVDVVEQSTPVNADCPHCQRRTLVARFHEDLIRCERDRHSRHYQACVCSDPLCDCKRDPVAHRHVWHRRLPNNTGPQPTWEQLRGRLTIGRAAAAQDTRRTTR